MNGWPRRRVLIPQDDEPHVVEYRMYGKTLTRRLETKTEMLARFMAKVRVDESGCWIWTGAMSAAKGGYGSFGVRRRVMRAHHVSYELHFGPFDRGEGHHGICVLHRCDVRACVNPEHLFLGTHAENVADMMAKKRDVRCFGERNPMTKLTAQQANEIRDRCDAGEVWADLAREFNVSHSAVTNIAKRRTWKPGRP